MLALIDIWEVVVGAGLRVTLAIVLATVLALTVGHLLGGPAPATRTATAISSAARNPGLALLVATLNRASPAIEATILAYLVIAAFTLIPYVIWRQRAAPPHPMTLDRGWDETTRGFLFPRAIRLDQSPPPQRYCQAIPTRS